MIWVPLEWRMLIKLINKKEIEQKHYVLEHKIIERDSCKKRS